MQHLRITCAAEVTEAVLDTLRNDAGTVHLSVLRGVVVDSPGDLVQADVVREAVDGLLADLCALGVDHVGGITLGSLDTVLSDAADAAAVVGAMVVGPEFALLAALAVGVVLRRDDRKLQRPLIQG